MARKPSASHCVQYMPSDERYRPSSSVFFSGTISDSVVTVKEPACAGFTGTSTPSSTKVASVGTPSTATLFNTTSLCL